MMKDCAGCGYSNLEGTLICNDCGQVLPDAAARTTLTVNPFDSLAHSLKSGSAIPGSGTLLMIETRIGMKPLPLKHGRRTILGRFDYNSPAQPDLDLTVYGAAENGVSRQHAVIDCSDDTPILIDLGSRNGTYINGLPLTPHKIYVLRHNDEVRLGKLIAHVLLD
jgi:pSer/pThr/pTyr-binding forkhead associated (FHA) protein